MNTPLSMEEFVATRDLPRWENLFGTSANSTEEETPLEVRVGFAPEAARRVSTMLLRVDVNRGGRELYIGRQRL